VAEDRDQWRAVVVSVISIPVPYKARNIDWLSNCQLLRDSHERRIDNDL
jgi:hypothetical protein